MNDISPKDILSHPLIREILKKRIASAPIIHRLIVEELLSEVDKENITAIIIKQFRTILSSKTSHVDRLKAGFKWLDEISVGIAQADFGNSLLNLFPEYKRLFPTSTAVDLKTVITAWLEQLGVEKSKFGTSECIT